MLYKEDGIWCREDDDGNVLDLDVQEEWVICDECRGEGKSLCDGMRGHAYSAEEFQESFPEDEDKHQYFNGFYDTRCDSCKGSGKVKAIDFEKLEKANPRVLTLFVSQPTKETR